MEITEEQIKKHADEYEELMRKLKSPADAGGYDELRKGSVMEEYIRTGSEERLAEIKKVLSFDLSAIKSTPEYRKGEVSVSGFQRELLNDAEDWFDIVRLINSLLDTTKSL